MLLEALHPKVPLPAPSGNAQWIALRQRPRHTISSGSLVPQLHQPKYYAVITLGIGALQATAPQSLLCENLIGCAAGLPLLLLVEALGVEGAGGRSNAGEDRQRNQC